MMVLTGGLGRIGRVKLQALLVDIAGEGEEGALDAYHDFTGSTSRCSASCRTGNNENANAV